MATDRPREELARIISTCGREIVSDPRRTEGLLRDTCASCGREVFILASVQKKNIPGELLTLAPSVPREILLRRLAERVVKELGFAPEHALWAVVSWALALGVITREALTQGGREEGAPIAIGQVVRNPADPSIWGIRNLSQAPWRVTFPDGRTLEIPPGKSVPLNKGTRIDLGGIQAEIVP